MHEATCTNCGRDVQITPDAEFCSACGENLKALIPIEKMSQYFYDRASHLAETISIRAALEETRRALEQVSSPELQLLGAILAESEGEYDLMRRYVSRIPVADRLRDEGEWLLRSHQARQSAQRLGNQGRTSWRETIGYSPSGHSPSDHSDTESASPTGQSKRAEDELLSMRTRRIGQLAYDTQIVGPTREVAHAVVPVNMLDPNQGARRLWPAAIALILLFGVLWGGWQFFGGGNNDQQANNGQEIEAINGSATTGGENGTMVEPQVTVTGNQQPADSAPVQNPITPNENNVPNDLTNADDGTQPVAGLENGAGIASPYDINGYLLNRGRADLAAFRLDAIQEGNQLVISGAVDTAEQRKAVIELAQTTSDLVTVSALELVVRQPNTYIIEEGDTLWLIADKLYGNGERWNDIFEANQDILSSPDAIIVGQELTVPNDR